MQDNTDKAPDPATLPKELHAEEIDMTAHVAAPEIDAASLAAKGEVTVEGVDLKSWTEAASDEEKLREGSGG